MTSPQWFVVERITGERKNDDGETTHFRVKWANYPDAESTWEPAARVKRASDSRAVAELFTTWRASS